MKIVRYLLWLYLLFASCGDARRRTVFANDLSVVDTPTDMALTDFFRNEDSRCNNGDPPEWRKGGAWCPCCRERDDMCNIPPQNDQICKDCVLWEYSRGDAGSQSPCLPPPP